MMKGAVPERLCCPHGSDKATDAQGSQIQLHRVLEKTGGMGVHGLKSWRGEDKRPEGKTDKI